MKTHELADQLDVLASLLRSIPNAEIDETLKNKIKNSFPLEGKDRKKESSQSKSLLREGVEEKLYEMSPAEIEEFLNSEVESFTSNNLLEIAKRLGVSSSKRQSKNALINLITRHFEAKQMHSIIYNKKTEDK